VLRAREQDGDPVNQAERVELAQRYLPDIVDTERDGRLLTQLGWITGTLMWAARGGLEG
jgi:hypothetical protein